MSLFAFLDISGRLLSCLKSFASLFAESAATAKSAVSLGGWGGGTPRVTPSRGVIGYPNGKTFCGQIYKESWTNEVGQVKKVRGDTLQ